MDSELLDFYEHLHAPNLLARKNIRKLEFNNICESELYLIVYWDIKCCYHVKNTHFEYLKVEFHFSLISILIHVYELSLLVRTVCPTYPRPYFGGEQFKSKQCVFSKDIQR